MAPKVLGSKVNDGGAAFYLILCGILSFDRKYLLHGMFILLIVTCFVSFDCKKASVDAWTRGDVSAPSFLAIVDTFFMFCFGKIQK